MCTGRYEDITPNQAEMGEATPLLTKSTVVHSVKIISNKTAWLNERKLELETTRDEAKAILKGIDNYNSDLFSTSMYCMSLVGGAIGVAGLIYLMYFTVNNYEDRVTTSVLNGHYNNAGLNNITCGEIFPVRHLHSSFKEKFHHFNATDPFYQLCHYAYQTTRQHYLNIVMSDDNGSPTISVPFAELAASVVLIPLFMLAYGCVTTIIFITISSLLDITLPYHLTSTHRQKLLLDTWCSKQNIPINRWDSKATVLNKVERQISEIESSIPKIQNEISDRINFKNKNPLEKRRIMGDELKDLRKMTPGQSRFFYAPKDVTDMVLQYAYPLNITQLTENTQPKKLSNR